MKVIYNKNENVIEIQDNIKAEYLVIILLLVSVIFTSFISIGAILDNEIDLFNVIILFAGIFSMFFLYSYLFKKSYDNRIKLEKISKFNSTDVFGKRVLSFKLKDGRERDLDYFSDETEMEQTIVIARNAGVPVEM